MATPVTLKVSNRIPKKPIKKLPTSIEVNDKTTVQDVKDKLAKAAGGRDPNRLGLYEPEKKKLLKDRRALISQQTSVIDVKELLVKDLGPQMSWITVFVIEYSGPIIIHLLFPFLLRPYLYAHSTPLPPLSRSQYLASTMIITHFLKREYETLFIHRFSLATMPVINIFRNCFHYWVLAGAWLAYWIYRPDAYTSLSTPTTQYLDIAGTILFLFGEVSNFLTHLTLANLRSPGGTERGIPKGYGFGVVTCPNYGFELLAWIGVLLVARSAALVLFLVVAFVQMRIWANKKERALRVEFPGKYRKKNWVMFPGLV